MDPELGFRDDVILYEGKNSTQDDSNQQSPTQKSLLNNPNTRLQFARKVFSIVSVQLIFTALMSYISMNNFSFAQFQFQNIAILILTTILMISIMITLMCSKRLVRIVPTNYILLAFFTSCQSYFVSFVCGLLSWNDQGQAQEDGKQIVYLAATFTIGVTLALVAYAYQTKDDISVRGSMIFVIISIFSLSSLLFLFYSLYIFETIMCALCAFIYSIYIVYDCQLIMGGRGFELTVDDYILGAMMLYVDIIRLFLRMLELISRLKK